MHCSSGSRQDHPNLQRGLQKIKVKDDGPISHHWGTDYTRGKDKTVVCRPKKYIDRLIESYHSMFKQYPPKNMRTPLDKNDHPELDDTDLVTGESNQHYFTMIGLLQWLVTLSRFDIMHKLPPSPDSDLLQEKGTWKGYKGYMDMSGRPSIFQPCTEPRNLTTATFPT